MKNENLKDQREQIANLYVAKVMRVCAAFTMLALVLNFIGVFTTDRTIMLLACLIGGGILMIPTIILKGFHKNESWLKYVNIIASCLFVAIVTSTLNYFVTIMFVFPMALASIYYNPVMNYLALVLSVIAASSGKIIAFVANTSVDANHLTWRSLLISSILPNILMLCSIGYIFIALAKSTNQMMSSLMNAEEQEKLFNHMKMLSDKSTEVSKGLSEGMLTLSNVTESTKKINYEISQNTDVVVDGIRNSMEQLTIAEGNSAKIYENIQNLVGESEEIACLFEDVESLSDENKILMQSVTYGMDKMKQSSDVCQKAMKLLEEKTKKIDGIVGVIEDISDQTNLLSLNAAIESARAGEQGKGFAVVSEEIRKLSQQTQKTLNDVREIIGEVLEQNTIAVDAINQTAHVHDEQKDVITRAEESAQGVMSAMKEMSEKMQLITNNTRHIETSTRQIVDIVNMITKICQDNQESLYSVSVSAETGAASMEELESLVNSIREMADELSIVVNS